MKILETIIAQTISPISSLFVAQRSSALLLGEHGEILGRLEVGWEKVACWSTKVAISLKRIKIEKSYYGGPYRKSPTLFRMVPPVTPIRPPFPLDYGLQPQPKLQSLLSQERLRLYAFQIFYAHSKTFRALIGLIAKLSSYDTGGNLLSWFQEYLSSRSHCTRH